MRKFMFAIIGSLLAISMIVLTGCDGSDKEVETIVIDPSNTGRIEALNNEIRELKEDLTLCLDTVEVLKTSGDTYNTINGTGILETGSVETGTVEELPKCIEETVYFPEQPLGYPQNSTHESRSEILRQWNDSNKRYMTGRNDWQSMVIVFRKELKSDHNVLIKTDAVDSVGKFIRGRLDKRYGTRLFDEASGARTNEYEFDLSNMKIQYADHDTDFREFFVDDFRLGGFVGKFNGQGMESITFSNCK